MTNNIPTKNKKEPRVKPVKSDFKERINQLYNEQNKSISAMAKDAGISPAAMNYYLSGERMPDLEGLRRICNAFSCSADWLLGLTDVRSSSEDVRTAVTNLGISERFVHGVKHLDNASRDSLFKIIDIIVYDEVLLSEYQDFCRILGAMAEKALIMKDNGQDKKLENQEGLDWNNGLVVLSHKETTEFYANKIGDRLTATLMADARKLVEQMGCSIDEM